MVISDLDCVGGVLSGDDVERCWVHLLIEIDDFAILRCPIALELGRLLSIVQCDSDATQCSVFSVPDLDLTQFQDFAFHHSL